MKGSTRNGECNSSKAQVRFHVEDKVDIKPYVGEVDPIELNHWIQKLDVYFNMYEVIGKQNILFSQLNLEIHALAWWESDAIRKELENEPLVANWEVLKDIIKAQFYLIECDKHQYIVWYYVRQRKCISCYCFFVEIFLINSFGIK